MVTETALVTLLIVTLFALACIEMLLVWTYITLTKEIKTLQHRINKIGTQTDDDESA